MKLKNIINLTTAAVTLTGVLATTGTARAATMTKSASLPLTSTPITDAPLMVEKFDSSQGTLQEVTLNLSGDLELLSNSFVGLENPTDEADTLTVAGDLALNDESGNLIDEDLKIGLELEKNLNITDDSPVVVDFMGTTYTGVNVSGTESNSATMSFLPGDDGFDMFVGSGDLEFEVNAGFDTQIDGPGNFLALANTKAAADLQVTYDFDETTTDVPEPGMLVGSMVLGLGGLFGQRRLRADR